MEKLVLRELSLGNFVALEKGVRELERIRKEVRKDDLQTSSLPRVSLRMGRTSEVIPLKMGCSVQLHRLVLSSP